MQVAKYRSSWRWLEDSNTEGFDRQSPHLLLQNFHAASENLHEALFSCCRSLLVSMNVLEHADANYSQSSTSVKFKTIMVLGLGYGFSDSSRALYFRISTTWSKVGLWWWEFSNTKTSSTTRVQNCALDVMWSIWGQNDLSKGILLRTFLSKIFSLVLRSFCRIRPGPGGTYRGCCSGRDGAQTSG